MGDLLKKLRAGLRKHPLCTDLRKYAPTLFAALADPKGGGRDPSLAIENACKAAADPKAAEALFRTWIEIQDGRAWLRREHRELATAAVLDADAGIASKVWSLAFVHEPDDRSVIVRAFQDGLMDRGKLSHFVSACVSELRLCGERDLVFRPKLDGSAAITRGSFRESSPLETIHRFERGGHDILRFDTFDSIVRLIDLAMWASPSAAAKLIAASDHPALFVLCARTAGERLRHDQPQAMLEWITRDAPAPVIAAGIYELMKTVNFFDSRRGGQQEERREGAPAWTDPGDLLNGMVTKLGGLHETQYGQYAGTLFSLAEYVLYRAHGGVGGRLTHLLEALEVMSAGVLEKSRAPQEIVESLTTGMLIPPRRTTVRHLRAIASRLETSEDRLLSTALSQRVVDNYHTQVDDHRGRHFYVGFDADGIAWTNAVGESLAVLAQRRVLDVSARFRALWHSFALEVWDYEEDSERFENDVRLALHILAAYAVAALQLRALGERASSSELCAAVVAVFLPFQDMVHALGVHLTDSHERFAAPTVVAMMVELDEHDEQLRRFLLSAAASVDCLVAVQRRSRSEPTRTLARAQLEARFDALRVVPPGQAQGWIDLWHELEDYERGLTAVLGYSGDFRTDREVGWKTLDLALRAAEANTTRIPSGHVVATIQRVADSLWGLWCPTSEEPQRRRARERIDTLGILCV